MSYPQPVSSTLLEIQQHVPLAPFTTLGIGGPARYFARIPDEPTLLEALRFARERHLPTFTLGGGSNLLIPDTGFDGLVLHLAIQGPTILTAATPADPTLTYDVPAGTDWDAFVLQVAQANLSGIECLAGIPGLVGGTPVQNVGAYGQEVSQTIASVRALDLTTNAFTTLTAQDCHFAYRQSIFNSTHRDRYIVTRVTFRFDPRATPPLGYADLQKHFAHHQPTPLEIYHAVRAIRQAKGMLLVPGDPDCRSAGSFFKNPIVPAATLTHLAATLALDSAAIPHWPAGQGSIKLPAAWLLDQAGFHKGFTLGNAGISSKHTLALINRGHATSADITRLRDTIQSEVLRRFQIPLEQEPVQPA